LPRYPHSFNKCLPFKFPLRYRFAHLLGFLSLGRHAFSLGLGDLEFLWCLILLYYFLFNYVGVRTVGWVVIDVDGPPVLKVMLLLNRMLGRVLVWRVVDWDHVILWEVNRLFSFFHWLRRIFYIFLFTNRCFRPSLVPRIVPGRARWKLSTCFLNFFGSHLLWLSVAFILARWHPFLKGSVSLAASQMNF
jgi:hypothetical protein